MQESRISQANPALYWHIKRQHAALSSVTRGGGGGFITTGLWTAPLLFVGLQIQKKRKKKRICIPAEILRFILSPIDSLRLLVS